MNTRKWYPISEVLVFGKHISELLSDSKAQYAKYLPLKDQPSSLDDAVVNRMKKLFTQRAEMIELYQQQVDKWQLETTNHQDSLNTLQANLIAAKTLNNEILDLVEYLGKHTINKILAMSDLELAIRTLSGGFPLAKHRKVK